MGYAAIPDEGVRQIDFLSAIVGIPVDQQHLSVPVDKIYVPDFRDRQWPRILAQLAVKREKYAKRKARAKRASSA